jgi:hypothetical protein
VSKALIFRAFSAVGMRYKQSYPQKILKTTKILKNQPLRGILHSSHHNPRPIAAPAFWHENLTGN